MTGSFLSDWQILVGGLGSLGLGGVCVRLHDRFRGHQKDTRAQTDHVALDLVEKLSARIEALEAQGEHDRKAAEAREQLCDANLEVVRHELRNVEGAFDALLLALKHAPADRHDAIIEEVRGWREDRRARKAQERGDFRNDTQAIVSAARVVGDAVARV